jgi:signal transduction histidine kinase
VNVESALLLEQAESERLAELSRLKSYFVSSVSHDLKTPLTSIRLFAELLADHEDLPRQKALEYLGIIEGESDRLSRLITNVLDFAKIEKGTKEYSFKQCDLNNIVRDVLRSLDYQITSHGFQVHTNIYTELLRIEADADAVFDAMTNLISNAMKYSPPDRKCITIETASKDGFAILSIQDEGYGIPQEEIDHIFESFYRIDDVKLKSAGGAGIGLSIVKHTMNAHRGKVEVQSEVGKGSTFALLFPLLPQ